MNNKKRSGRYPWGVNKNVVGGPTCKTCIYNNAGYENEKKPDMIHCEYYDDVMHEKTANCCGYFAEVD